MNRIKKLIFWVRVIQKRMRVFATWLNKKPMILNEFSKFLLGILCQLSSFKTFYIVFHPLSAVCLQKSALCILR